VTGVAIVHLGELFPAGRVAAAVRVALVAPLLAYNAFRIADYLIYPKYTFVRMANEVADLVNASTSQRPAVLLGTLAASVALERSLVPISPEYAVGDLQTRLAMHCPTHLITLQAPGEDEDRALSPFYTIEPIAEWNVFDDYYEHRPVRLARLHAKVHHLPACAAVP
jgi:hypothetical protein